MRRKISPFTNTAFRYGLGLYETMRAINKEIIFFTEHFNRLWNALNRFKLPLVDPREINFTIKEKMEKKNLDDARIRVTYSLQGPDLKALLNYEVLPFEPLFQKQAKITFSKFILKHNDELRRFKTTSNFIYFLEFINAHYRGIDEVIFFDDAGHILEGSRTNIFFIFYGEKLGKFYIKTPSLDCGILPGIAREKVIKLCKELRIRIFEEPLYQTIFKEADEVFLTNSVHGIVPVRSAPGSRKLPSEKTEIIKQEFQKRYLLFY